MSIGVQELAIILIIVLIIFGPTQVPKLMKMFGEGVRSFKDAVEGVEETKKDDKKDK